MLLLKHNETSCVSTTSASFEGFPGGTSRKLARCIRHKSQDLSTFQGRTVITLGITSQAIYLKGGMIFIYFM